MKIFCVKASCSCRWPSLITSCSCFWPPFAWKYTNCESRSRPYLEQNEFLETAEETEDKDLLGPCWKQRCSSPALLYFSAQSGELCALMLSVFPLGPDDPVVENFRMQTSNVTVTQVFMAYGCFTRINFYLSAYHQHQQKINHCCFRVWMATGCPHLEAEIREY